MYRFSKTLRHIAATACVAASSFMATAANAQAKAEVGQIQIVVEEMCCNGCAQKIAAQLYTLPGITNVSADVPSHVFTLTFRQSPKLTLDAIWRATEKGAGKPFKLVTSQATYTLQRPEQLKLKEPLAPNRYWLVVEKLADEPKVQQATKGLYAIRGVKTVTCDAASRTFYIETSANDALSPWALISAVEPSGHSIESLTGPLGVLTVQRPVPQSAQATQQPQQQGVVR